MKLHPVLRRITLCVIALAVSLSLTTGNASAQDPDRSVDWTISTLETGGGDTARSNYATAMTALRNHVSTEYRNGIRQLTTERYLVKVRVWNKGNRVATLYFWSDNLYLAGFRDSGFNVYHFSNVDGADMEQRLGYDDRFRFTTLNYTGDYTSIPGGSERNLLRYNARIMHQSFMNLGSFDPNATSATYTNSLLRVIRVTAESVRNGHLRNSISHTFTQDYTATTFSNAATIENNWRTISRWVRAETQDPTANGTLTVGDRSFNSFSQLLAWSPTVTITSR